MTDLIFGKAILDCKLLINASEENLKNTTYDMTIGEIYPLGAKGVKERRTGGPESIFIEPSEMVLVLSKEEFQLPSTVTGVATLRTTFTKAGILALNVGIIDPHFDGPISTALINFSDRPFQIHVGDKFFRVLFLCHESASGYKPASDESVRRIDYERELENDAYSKFPTTYLNIPVADRDYLSRNFWKSVRYGLTTGYGWFGSGAIFIFLTMIWYVVMETGYGKFYLELLKKVKDLFL